MITSLSRRLSDDLIVSDKRPEKMIARSTTTSQCCETVASIRWPFMSSCQSYQMRRVI